MKRFSKLFSLLAAFCVLFSSVSVLAAVPDEFLSVEDITAVWNGDIDTDWYTVYGDYKLLDSDSRQNADYVIAGNAYRFLIATGSNPEGAFTWSKWDDFAAAVSPFNLAYNNFVAEAVVHSAWLICSDEFKIFCANVIHNLNSAPTYYDSKVIEVNDFTNNAARGNLTFQFNVNGNLDIGTISIGNNIFNNTVLTSTSSSIGYYFNPNPLLYNGRSISLSEVFSFKSSSPSGSRFTPFVPGFINNNFNSSSSSLYIPSIGTNYANYPEGNYILLSAYIYSDNSYNISLDKVYSRNFYSYYFNLSNYEHPSFSYDSRTYFFSSSFNSSNYYYVSISDLLDNASLYFSNVISPYLVYADGIKILVGFSDGTSYFYDVPFPNGSNLVSPQFSEINYYVDNSVYSPDNSVAYYYNNDLINNVVNNDYSTIDNSNRYEFFNDNYYFLSEGSGSNGGDTLVTNNNITYNYITINNNTPTPTQDFYNVKIINPEDIRNETIINENQSILNEYEFNLGDLNISTGVSSAVNNISAVFDDNVDADQTQSLLSGIVGAFPSDLFAIVIGFLAASIIIGVIMKVISH